MWVQEFENRPSSFVSFIEGQAEAYVYPGGCEKEFVPVLFTFADQRRSFLFAPVTLLPRECRVFLNRLHSLLCPKCPRQLTRGKISLGGSQLSLAAKKLAWGARSN